MARDCSICGRTHESNEIMTLDDLRKIMIAAGDRCPALWDALNVAQVLITEVDRINAETVKLRAQIPRRIKFQIDDTTLSPAVLLLCDPKPIGPAKE